MAIDGLKLVVLRNEFYRDGYRRACIALLLVFLLNCVIAGTILYKWVYPPQPAYFATTADGRMIMLHPLSDPSVPDNFVVQWATAAVQQTFSLDYVHWRQQLQEASNNFTPGGWKDFLTSLQSSNDLKTLIQLNMVSNITVTGSPQILEKAVVGGHYAWKIDMPVLLTFYGKEHTLDMPMDVILIVVRMPVQDYPQRIAINNFLVKVNKTDIDSSGF